MQKPMNAQLSTTLGLGLLVISTVGTPGLEPSSKYFEIEFVNLWWNQLVGFRLKPKFGSVSGDCCSVISSRATLWLISCHMRHSLHIAPPGGYLISPPLLPPIPHSISRSRRNPRSRCSWLTGPEPRWGYARTSFGVDVAAEVTISKCNLWKSRTLELTSEFSHAHLTIFSTVWDVGWFYQDHASRVNAKLQKYINIL